MAYHIPFSHRPSGRKDRPVYYIGFESRRPRRVRNWWGINSLILFFLTFGIMSPITLLMGLKGLRRRPRGTAFVGTALSLVGTAAIGLAVITFAGHVQEAKVRQIRSMEARRNAPLVADTLNLLAFAAEEFEGYRDDNGGQLPGQKDGNLLSIKHIDPWGQELMYEVEFDYAGLRSAGPDKEFFSADDVTRSINGKTDVVSLLPVDESLAGEELTAEAEN